MVSLRMLSGWIGFCPPAGLLPLWSSATAPERCYVLLAGPVAELGPRVLALAAPALAARLPFLPL